ncbi:hypothetical protein Bbelb_165140 [Branchiostoma belcheri]|nr:hypothetical protein Bbelb_165140 [Branchiostoma belcheri]
MAGQIEQFEGMTEEDKLHFDFMETLLKVSEALTKEETADLKLYCMHLIPKGRRENLHRAVDVFVALLELRKIDRENMAFVEETLVRIRRPDVITNILRPFLRPDREIPETPELQPGTSSEDTDEEGRPTANTYVVLHGQVRMIQETLDRLVNNLASLCGTRKSKVKFRGYKKHESILAHFSIPRESKAVLRLMADNSDPRLVFMGVKSLQFDAEVPIKVTQGALLYDLKRQRTVDDIEVGCSTRTKQQRAPRNWTRLSALNLFSDTLPLYLQVAESLEYQGFSYSLVQALVQKDQLREYEMKQLNQSLKKAEVDSNALRSSLTISENRLEEALQLNAVLENKLYQAGEYTEKRAEQVTSHEYRGEKRHADPPLKYVRKKAREESTVKDEDKEAVTLSTQSEEERTEEKQTTVAAVGAEGAAPPTIGDFRKGMIIYGKRGSEPGNFLSPRGVVVSTSNEIFVADAWNTRVQVHNTKGTYLRHFPTVVPGTEDKEMAPHDISMDNSGTLWVVGNGKSADYVVQYNTDGTAMTQFHLQKSKPFRGIAVDKRNNHILVTDADQNNVQVFRSDGSLVQSFGHPEEELRNPRYLTVDGEGNVLVSDWSTHFVYMFDESAKFLLKFGGQGSGEGQLRSPRGICTDSLGYIIMAESGNERVQMFTRHGVYVRTIETGSSVEGVAVGPDGQLIMTNMISI